MTAAALRADYEDRRLDSRCTVIFNVFRSMRPRGHAGVLLIVVEGVPMYPLPFLGLRGPSSTLGELGVV